MMPRSNQTQPTVGDRLYLGDAVYADINHDTQEVILTTTDGFTVINRIILEIETLDALIQFLRRHGVKLPVSGKV